MKRALFLFALVVLIVSPMENQAHPDSAHILSEKAGDGPTGKNPHAGDNWQILFFDDFEDGHAPSWNLFGGWEIREGVLAIGGETPFRTFAGSETWTDYSLSFRYRPKGFDERANLRINFRVDWPERKHYSLILSPSGNLIRLEKNIWEVPRLLEETPYRFERDKWHDIDITVRDGRIWISIDNVPLIELEDEDPFLFGRIGISAEHTRDAICEIDDVKLFGTFEGPAWEHLNAPHGGRVARILIDPTDSRNILVTAEHGSVYKSTDGGRSWVPTFRGLNTVDLLVKGFAMSPHDSKLILVLSTDGPYRTTDQAASWQKVAKITSPDGPYTLGKGVFAFSPSDPNRVYLGSDKDIEEDDIRRGGSFFVSTDAGKSFVALPASNLNKNVTALAVHPQDPEIVFVGTRHDGILKTTDGGKTWKKGLLEYGYTDSIQIHPQDPTIMFAVAGEKGRFGALFKGTDEGNAWQRVTTLPRDLQTVTTVKITPSNFIYVIGGDRLLISANGGKDWTEREVKGAYGIYDIAIDPDDPEVLVVGHEGGMLISRNGGRSWEKSVQGLGALGIISLSADPSDPSTVYAGDWSGGGLHKSTDGGRTWQNINIREGFIPNIHSIAVDPNDPQTVYAAPFDNGIFKTTDGGESWQGSSNGLASLNISQIAISHARPNILYVGATEMVNYHGRSGQKSTGGIYRSLNGGREWIDVSSNLKGENIQSIALHPEDPDIVYVGTASKGVFKSIDGGTSWKIKNSGFQSHDTYIQSIVINPKNPMRLYAGINRIYESRLKGEPTEAVTGGGALYQSIDGGEVWTKLALDDSIASIEKIVINPKSPNNIYVATHSPGVYTSHDEGTTWRPMNMGMLYLNETYGGHNYVFSLAISGDGSTLYAGSCGRGVFKATLEVPIEQPTERPVEQPIFAKRVAIILIIAIIVATVVFLIRRKRP